MIVGFVTLSNSHYPIASYAIGRTKFGQFMILMLKLDILSFCV